MKSHYDIFPIRRFPKQITGVCRSDARPCCRNCLAPCGVPSGVMCKTVLPSTQVHVGPIKVSSVCLRLWLQLEERKMREMTQMSAALLVKTCCSDCATQRHVRQCASTTTMERAEGNHLDLQCFIDFTTAGKKHCACMK